MLGVVVHGGQLLDLMGRQRRDVVPKCARHSQSELMFCETCDVVFCVDCAGASHAGASSAALGSPALGAGNQAPATGPAAGTASAHTVIPFSIAIKRMSEILLYKVMMMTALSSVRTVQCVSNHCLQWDK